MNHTCHSSRCSSQCNAEDLLCPSCWEKVPAKIADRVRETSDSRNPLRVDKTWAPWWRAQAEAIAVLDRLTNVEAAELRLKKELDFADMIERRQ